MKQTCIACGKNIEVEFKLTMKNAEGIGIGIVVKCKYCGIRNDFHRILQKDASKEELKEFEKEFKKNIGGYIG